MTVVAAHQPNFLCGMNVLDKVDSADAVIWLDDVQYTKGGWTNRNKGPAGNWLTVPIVKDTDGGTIREVLIADGRDWRRKVADTIVQTWGGGTWPLQREILKPYRRLVALNAALLQVLMPIAAARTIQHWQSHLENGGHRCRAVADTRIDLQPISLRLAGMVEEVGGTVYLSGPSGRNYLDERPFEQRGIQVRYYQHFGSQACGASLFAEMAVR
jgi:WbqC-like protein family